jgi:hypothetical protein
MNCGDVIIAAPGTYATGMASWGTISNCPSTTGGIDGTGGIYAAVLLCGGNVGTCKISISGGAHGMDVLNNYWAIEGWEIDGDGTGPAFFAGSISVTQSVHHVFFINDIASNVGRGFGTGGTDPTHNVPGIGIDNFAVVGSIAYKAAQDTGCLGAVDIVAPANNGPGSPTPTMFVWGNFAYSSILACTSDVEAYLIDTLDAHGWQGNVIVAHNNAWNNSRYCIQLFYQGFNPTFTSVTMKTYNNTCYHNNVGSTGFGGGGGEINIQAGGGATTFPYTMTVNNNIAYSDLKNGGFSSGFENYAYWIGGNYNVTTGAAAGGNNVFLAVADTCPNTCDGGNNAVTFGTALGTNTYTNPTFANTSDLLTNWVGAPSCGSFALVVQCMGWNAATNTLTSLTPVADLVAGCGSSCTGNGYQKPTMTCPTTNADWPTYLKGLVVLQWTGSIVQQVAGAVPGVPCGN